MTQGYQQGGLWGFSGNVEIIGEIGAGMPDHTDRALKMAQVLQLARLIPTIYAVGA